MLAYPTLEVSSLCFPSQPNPTTESLSIYIPIILWSALSIIELHYNRPCTKFFPSVFYVIPYVRFHFQGGKLECIITFGTTKTFVAFFTKLSLLISLVLCLVIFSHHLRSCIAIYPTWQHFDSSCLCCHGCI